jgi:Bacterial aa3 type cytochrome c oxidase subunit IV
MTRIKYPTKKGKFMAGNNDLKAAQGTYEGFIGWVKIGSIITIAITALVVIIIAS